MYKILTDALLHPRELLKYRNKSGWFVLAYFAVLALFCTIGPVMFYITYAQHADFNAESAACEYVDAQLVCADAARDYAEPLDFFGNDAYFLPADADVADLGLASGVAIVFQDQFVAFFLAGDPFMTVDLTPFLAPGETLGGFMEGFSNGFIAFAVVVNFIGNILLLAAFTAMSAISLVRLRGYLRFGKAYTILAFAAFPFALVLTFQNILGLPEWALMLLMVVSFRSSFLVIRELYDQAYQYLNPDPPAASEGDPKPDEEDERTADRPDDDSDDSKRDQ